jgi:hypothetical protein
MKFFVSCVTYEPKLRPTMQCHVGLYFLSNSFLMCAATSFSILYSARALQAQSMASWAGETAVQSPAIESAQRARPHARTCCMSSDISAFLITARRMSELIVAAG